LRPEYPTALLNYALLLKKSGHSRKAQQQIQKAFRLDPEDPAIKAAHEGRAWRK
jgi:hypothetical protein